VRITRLLFKLGESLTASVIGLSARAASSITVTAPVRFHSRMRPSSLHQFCSGAAQTENQNRWRRIPEKREQLPIIEIVANHVPASAPGFGGDSSVGTSRNPISPTCRQL
jgi:hypothetical protein